MVTVTFIQPNGTERKVDATVGDSLMVTAVNNMIEGIVAECGGNLSCATCHIHVDDRWLKELGEPTEAERDMLQFASDQTNSSRLSCQIKVTEHLDGMIVRIPG